MGFVSEFKKFAIKGNVIDLAVGVVIGAAFGKIVSALVDNIIMPLVGILTGGHDFTKMAVKVGDAEFKYGLFIQSVVDFIIVALVLFIAIRGINKLKHEEPAAPAGPPEPSSTDKLLIEIRDELKNK